MKFLQFRRILPEEQEADLVVNSDHIVWAQEKGPGLSSLEMAVGPNLEVKASLAQVLDLLKTAEIVPLYVVAKIGESLRIPFRSLQTKNLPRKFG